MESGSCQRPVPVAASGPSDKLIPSSGRVDIYTFCFSDRCSAGIFLWILVAAALWWARPQVQSSVLEKQGFGEAQP
jgi:hypothetical protein